MALFTLYEVIYLITFYGGWTLVFCLIYPSIDASHQVSSQHKLYGIMVFGACIASWTLVTYLSSPGEITHETLAQFNHYAGNDPPLLNENTATATTSNHSVPSLQVPRSKFHRGKYIPRFDHHCYILNRSIGECNYRYFLILVLLHTGMCWYGSTIVFRLVWENVQLSHSGMSLVRKPLTWMTLLPRWICMLYEDVLGTVLAMMLGVLAAALTAFLMFHVYLIVTNTTTFEFFQRRRQRQERIRATISKTKQQIHMVPSTKGRHQSASSGADDEENPLAASATRAAGRGRPPNKNAGPMIPLQNVYNQGLFSNIGEFLYPRCYRRANHRGGRKHD